MALNELLWAVYLVHEAGGISIWKYLEAREMSVPTEGTNFFLMCVSMPRLALLWNWKYFKTHTVLSGLNSSFSFTLNSTLG